MNCIKTYWLLTIFVIFLSCSERVIVSDADSLGLRFKVKSMNESFYIAYNSFDSIVLYQKIYQYKYTFHYDCRYKSIEKNFYYNRSPFDSIFCDSSTYYHANYNYVSDSIITVDFFDGHGNLKNYINKIYAENRFFSEEQYSDSGNLISKSRFWYDSKNQLLNKTIFYENDYRETNYAYSAGEKFETGDEFNYRYRFDIHGRISSKKVYKGVTFVSEISLYYDDYGNVIKTQEIDKKGIMKKTLYDYIYDANKNWILCVEYNYTGNIFVRKREITYYS